MPRVYQRRSHFLAEIQELEIEQHFVVEHEQDLVAEQARIMELRLSAGLAIVRPRRYHCLKKIDPYIN